MWRGDALADFAYEEFAQPTINRLSELRLAAIEERIELELALGRLDEGIIELDGLVAAYPLRERLRGQLMIALYRAGRQADALRVFQDGRHILAEELGLEPGPELRRLEAAILAQDPELDAPRDRDARHGSEAAGCGPGGAHSAGRARRRAARTHASRRGTPSAVPRRSRGSGQDAPRAGSGARRINRAERWWLCRRARARR